MNPDNFKLITQYKSYISKAEITALDPRFLVRGSKNVFIDYALRVVSRPGYTLYGAAKDVATGCKGSYEWQSSTGHEFAFRSYGSTLQFDRDNTGVWRTLLSDLRTPLIEFTKIWDNTEKIDVLLFVLGEKSTRKWTGGYTTLASTTGTTLTKQGVMTAKTTIAFVAGSASVKPQITDSANGFVTAGFAAGDTLYVSGSTNNSKNFTIATVAPGTIELVIDDVLTSEAAGPAITLHNGEPTWAASRFLTTGTRKLLYNGTEYTYTGGDTTDTLTGLTAFPAITIGDPVWQTVVTLANPGAISTNFSQDLCGVELNQLILASSKSREVYGSANDDYTDFTLTSPRAPGDPFKITIDDNTTCIIPIDNPAENQTSTMFGAGLGEFFQLSFRLSDDNANELARIIKLATAESSGPITKSAIASIKKSTAYISNEPSLDTLSRLESADQNSVPLSDPIKDDFDSYDFTNAHVKYWKRSIYIALPNEGIVLIYDLMRNLWQPPWTMPIGRLAIIGGWLYGHSSIGNETYKLYDGTNDNGNFIPQIARFAYNNGGRRDRLKNLSEYWSDGYISPSAVLQYDIGFGFIGNNGIKSFDILGADSEITDTPDVSHMGTDEMGSLDGLPEDDVTPPSLEGLNRFYQIDTMDLNDYMESYVEYTMNTLNGRFALVAHGNNQWDAGTSPVSHKK